MLTRDLHQCCVPAYIGCQICLSQCRKNNMLLGGPFRSGAPRLCLPCLPSRDAAAYTPLHPLHEHKTCPGNSCSSPRRSPWNYYVIHDITTTRWRIDDARRIRSCDDFWHKQNGFIADVAPTFLLICTSLQQDCFFIF